MIHIKTIGSDPEFVIVDNNGNVKESHSIFDVVGHSMVIVYHHVMLLITTVLLNRVLK
jgi:hypothetical protein